MQEGSNSPGASSVCMFMRVKNSIFLLFTGILLVSCLDSNLDATDKVSDSDLIYLNPTQDPSNFANDPFRIVGIIPEGNLWSIIVEYGGGCNSHRFFTWWAGNFDLDSTVFYLYHDSNADPCYATIRDTVRIEVNEAIFDALPLETTTIVAINGSNNRKISVDPYLAAITQGNQCGYVTSLLSTSCGQGIWDNQWLLLKDTLTHHQKVWFQPVKNSTNVELRKPEANEYEVAVTALFGFEYTDLDENCQSRPEGSVVPVAINCLTKL